MENPSKSYEASPAIWRLHSVTCHPTQVNAPRLNSSQTGGPVLDLPTPEGWKADLTWVAGYILR